MIERALGTLACLVCVALPGAACAVGIVACEPPARPCTQPFEGTTPPGHAHPPVSVVCP